MSKIKSPKNGKMSILYMNPQMFQKVEVSQVSSIRHKSLTLKPEKIQNGIKNIKKHQLFRLNQYKHKSIQISRQNAVHQSQIESYISQQIPQTNTKSQIQKPVSSFQLYRIISKERNHRRGFSQGVTSQNFIKTHPQFHFGEKHQIPAPNTQNRTVTCQPGKRIKICQIQNYFNPGIAIHRKAEKGTTFISSFPRKINKKNSTDKKHLKTLIINNKQQIAIASRKIGFQNLSQEKQKSRNIRTAFQLKQRVHKGKNQFFQNQDKNICRSLPIWQKQKQQKHQKRLKFQNIKQKMFNFNQESINFAYRPWSPKNPQLFINCQQQMEQSIAKDLFCDQK